MFCKLDKKKTIRRGPDIFDRENKWRSSIISEHEIYRIYAIGKNHLCDDCEVLIDIEGNGRASWELVSVFEIVDNCALPEWIAKINFRDTGKHGDQASWTFLMGWPEIFRPGHLVGLMNLDRDEVDYFIGISKKYR